MSSDEENGRTKLLSDEPDEPTGKGHGETRKHADFQLYENRQHRNVNSEANKSGQFNPIVIPILPAIPKRFIILILVALANFNMYCVRMCVNVSIVAMTHGQGKSSNSSGRPLSQGMEPEFHWDKQFQGTILASLYWSYTALQIPAGLICVKYGGSFLLGIAIFGSSVLTLATPFIVRQNVYAFILLRIMEGAFLGLVAASAVLLMSKWSPVYERSIFMMVAYSGLLWGTVLANSLSGVLAGSSWGWQAVFYYFGVQGILWYICWIYFAYEEPSDHPNITEDELELIGKHWDTKVSFRDIPWKYMLTSIRVWAIIIPYFTNSWSFYTFIILFPSYLKDVQKLDITTIGLASSLPYLLSAVLSPTWGYFVDVLRRKKYITTTNARKLSSFLGDGISAIFIVAMVYTSTTTSAIAVASITIILGNFSGSGPAANIMELAPKYSGILMGIVNFAGNITGFIAPEVVGALTAHGDVRHQWAIVFYFTAGVNVLGMTFYLIFGSSDKQAWAEH